MFVITLTDWKVLPKVVLSLPLPQTRALLCAILKFQGDGQMLHTKVKAYQAAVRMLLSSVLNESSLNAYHKARLQAAPFLSKGSSLFLLTTLASGFLPLIPPLPTSKEWLSLLHRPLTSPCPHWSPCP